jgi:hypothetical protein
MRRAACALLLLAACHRARVLEAPEAPAGARSRALIVATERPYAMLTDVVDAPLPTFSAKLATEVLLAYFDRPLGELYLREGELALVRSTDPLRALPSAQAVLRAELNEGAWEAADARALADFRIEDAAAETELDCADASLCPRWVSDVVRREGVVCVPCSPRPPEPPRFASCPAGWSTQTSTFAVSCAPPPTVRCEDQFQPIDGSVCSSIGAPCRDRWPAALPASGVIYAGVNGTRDGEGSRDSPLTLSRALERAETGAIVALEEGTYTTTIAVPEGVELRGACALRTIISAPILTSTAVIVAGSASLRDLTLEGCYALAVLGGDATIEGSRLQSTPECGLPPNTALLGVRSGRAVVRGSLIRASQTGIHVRDGEVIVEGSAIEPARYPQFLSALVEASSIELIDVAIRGGHYGIHFRSGATAFVSRVLFETFRVHAMQIHGRETRVRIEDLVIRNGLDVHPDDETESRAVEILDAHVEAERLNIAHLDTVIYCRECSLDVRDVVTIGGRHADGVISLVNAATATITRAVFQPPMFDGVALTHELGSPSPKAKVFDVAVHHPFSQALLAEGSSQLTVERFYATYAEVGLSVYNGAAHSARDGVIENCQTGAAITRPFNLREKLIDVLFRNNAQSLILKEP